MYILTFKSKNSEIFGSSGVYETLEQIEDHIINLQSDNINGLFYGIEYAKDQDNAILSNETLLKYIRKTFKKCCTCEIEGENHFFNIREQKNIKKID